MKKVYTALLALGVVSLLGDIIYEGSRGIIPTFLRGLGASALVVGVISGVGEAINLIMRIVSGNLVDRSGAYWTFAITGYVLIVAIPLLAFVNRWELAALLIISERLGKAIRTPARDVILSECCKEIGRGKTFGIHEFLDQIGAIVGPVIVSIILLLSGSYRITFLFLILPFLLMMLMLTKAKSLVGRLKPARKRLVRFSSTSFRVYVLAVCLNTLTIMPAPLILYLLSGEVGAWIVPLVYALIQLIDAPAALAAGYLYDRMKQKVLMGAFVISVLPAPLAFFGGMTGLLASSLFLGLVLGLQESVYRAFIADIVPVEKRGSAYGIFNSVYGISFLTGSVLFGFLLEVGVGWPIVLTYTCLGNFAGIILLGSIREKIETSS